MGANVAQRWVGTVTIFRRLLCLATLMFWQGGFTFYSAVVVPTGSDVLGSPTQALVTRPVTNWLNIAGAVSLLVWFWESATGADPSRPRRRWRGALLSLLFISLAMLVWMHTQLDNLIERQLDGTENFYNVHRWYLIISTIQWLAAGILLVLTLIAWQGADRASP